MSPPIDFVKQLVLSPSDLWNALKKGWKGLVLAAFALSSLFLLKQLQQPLCYTAEGSYKVKSSAQNASAFSKFFMPDNESSSSYSAAEIEFLLTSHPLIETLVQKLDLQGSLIDLKEKRSSGSRFKRIWDNFLIEKSYRHYRKALSSSHGLSPDSPSTSQPLFPYPSPQLVCKNIIYSPAYHTSLKITFVDDLHFRVEQNGQLVGMGVREEPFIFEGGRFTLSSPSNTISKKACFALNLLPMRQTIEGFKKTISVKKHPKQFSLLIINYTHPNPLFAQKVVNSLLSCCQDYLENSGEAKINHQLDYLNRRRNETLGNIDLLFQEAKEHFSATLEKGEAVSYEGDMSFLKQLQSECFSNYSTTLLTMQRLYQSAFGLSVPLHEIAEKIRLEASIAPPTDLIEISSGGILNLLAGYEKEVEKTQFLQHWCATSIETLKGEASDCIEMVPIAQELHLPIAPILALNHKLADQKNWSSREKELLEEQLLFEKTNFIHLLEESKAGFRAKEESFRERILSLQKNALALLLQMHDTNAESLLYFCRKLENFPDKWCYEQKLALNQEIQQTIFAQVASLIETKNVSYNLEYLESKPYLWAIKPPLPNAPRLRFHALIGAFAGILLMSCFLCLREIYRGPTASQQNLEAANYHCIGELHCDKDNLEVVRHLANRLSVDKTLFLFSQASNSLPRLLTSLLQKRGERILVMDLQNPEDPQMKDEDFFASSQFQTALHAQQKTYDRVIIWKQAHPKDALTQTLSALCDQTIFIVTDERAKELSALPSSTLFLFQKPKKKRPPLSLNQVEPLLRQFMTKAFSAASSPLQRVKGSQEKP